MFLAYLGQLQECTPKNLKLCCIMKVCTCAKRLLKPSCPSDRLVVISK